MRPLQAATDESRTRRPTSRSGPAWAAGVLAFAVYLPSLGNGFALDDVGDIRENPVIQNATGPSEVMLSPYRGSVPPERSPYRPLTSLSFWVDWVVGGGSPLQFHAVNVLLHVMASVLTVHLLSTLGASTAGALVGGAVFAVHPVHVEAVANVVGRGDVLMTLFCLVGALVFLDRRLAAWRRALVVAAAYALALASKENGIVLPGLLALLVVLRPASRSTGNREEDESPHTGVVPSDYEGGTARELFVLAPTALVLAGYLALRQGVLGTLVHTDTAPYITVLPSLERLTTAVANLGHLGRLLVIPVDLVADYGPDVIVPAGLASPRFWAGLFLAALSAALGWTLYHRERLGTLALAWIALSALIVSNLVTPIGIWVAERTLYLPSVGVAMAIAALVVLIERHLPAHTATVRLVAAALVVAGAWKTVDRTPTWRDTDAVFQTLADEHPESFRSQWWLARSLTDRGDHERALRWFEEAERTNPNDLRLKLDHVRALLLAGRPAEAEHMASPLPPADPARFVYLAQSMIMTDRPDEARDQVREGLLRFPRDVRLIRQARELGLTPGAPGR